MNDKFLKNNGASIINSLETDYRAEVIAAEMIEAGQKADKLLVLQGENNTRKTSKNVYKMNYMYLLEDLTQFLCNYIGNIRQLQSDNRTLDNAQIEEKYFIKK